MKTYYALKCDMLHADKLTVKPDENSVATVVIHTDALAAVSAARADALRWVLGQMGVTAPRHIDRRIYSIVDDERARLRAIIEKELSR